MKFAFAEWRAAGEFRLFEAGREVISAKRKCPGFINSRTASTAKEIAPRNPAFDGPSFVLVAPIIDRTPNLYGRLEVKLPILLES